MADTDCASDPLEGKDGRATARPRWYKLQCVRQELRTILFFAFVNFLELTAYGPIETLQSSLNSESGLGALSLACLYGPYFIFAMAAPAVVRVLTPKWTVLAAWACDSVYIGANFYPTWLTLIPASALTGIATGPLWTAKDLYVSQMARQSIDADVEGFDLKYQEALSFYNGIIFAGFSLSGVVGQLISSAILTQSSASTSSSVCGAFNCQTDLMFIANATNATNVTISTTQPEKSLVYTLLGVLLSLVVLAMVLVTALLPKISFGIQNVSFRKTLTSCARRVKDVSMLLMLPQMIFFGFYQGIMQADYTKSYITCDAGVGMVGYVMMCRGLAATLASVVCGRLVRYTGRPIQVFCAFVGYTGVTIMMWLWTPSESHLALFFITPVIYGITDVIFQTHVCTLLAVLFKQDTASAFANFYTFRALSKALSFGLSGFVCVWIKLTIVSVLLALACVSFVVLEYRVRFKKSPAKESAAIEVMLEQPTSEDNAT